MEFLSNPRCSKLWLVVFFLRLQLSQQQNFRGWFKGPTARAVAAIYPQSTLEGDAMCYGGIVGWRDVIVTCSCVVNPPAGAWTPWSHPAGQNVVPKKPNDLIVTLMAFERDEKQKKERQSAVNEIKIHPGCDSSFAINLALLRLKKAIQGSRLLWVPSQDTNRLKVFIKSAALATAVSGHCFVQQWIFINETNEKPRWKITTDIVNLQHWAFCKKYVCPDSKPQTGVVNQNSKQCLNSLSVGGVNISRWCMAWNGLDPLCQVREGTPVICSAGALSGLIGILSNATVHCPDHFTNGILHGIDLSPPLIAKFPVQSWKEKMGLSSAQSTTPQRFFVFILPLLLGFLCYK